jgi:hypothetical protein
LKNVAKKIVVSRVGTIVGHSCLSKTQNVNINV